MKEGGYMKTSKLVLITGIAMMLSHSVMAENNENIKPPAGPYQSAAQAGQANQGYSSDQQNQQIRNMPGQYSAEVPEWVKQRRVQMEQWMKQQNNQPQPEWVRQRQAQMDQRLQQQPQMPPPQMQNNPRPQWNQNPPPAMRGPDSTMAPPPGNRMQQYFPSARGPVYGPAMPPPGFNGQPRYQAPQQWNPGAYPPVRR